MYFDGFEISASLPRAEDAVLAFTDLGEIFGVDLKLSKLERGEILEFVGVVFDLPQFPVIPPLFVPRDLKREKLKAQILEISGMGRAPPAARQPPAES